MPLQLNPISDPTKIGGFNTNFQLIEDYINDSLLKRAGLEPGEVNSLEADLDLNSQNISNVADIGTQSLTVAGTPVSTYIDRAETAADNAETSESNAASSASGAASSATAASSSASSAASSASDAATSETNAATSESNAASSAADAATSETNAGISATNALASENAAATSESNAATSESNAATSESNAATSASNASTSETNAANSASAAAATLDSFDDRYLGEKASDPSVDNDGDPLVVGTLYFNTTAGAMRVYDGSVWDDGYTTVDLQGNATGPIDMSGFDLTADSFAAERYDLASISTTDTLDLATGNTFTIDASAPRTLAFSNAPGAGRNMTVVLTISGASAITWPGSIRWHGDGTTAPELGATWTIVVLSWDGANWSGVLGASA